MSDRKEGNNRIAAAWKVSTLRGHRVGVSDQSAPHLEALKESRYVGYEDGWLRGMEVEVGSLEGCCDGIEDGGRVGWGQS
jgi:hypothetical protein